MKMQKLIKEFSKNSQKTIQLNNFIKGVSKFSFCRKKLITNHYDLFKQRKILKDIINLNEHKDYMEIAAATQSEMFHVDLLNELSINYL
jgi:hypothetical protein